MYIDKTINQNLRNKDVYESDMHNIYNLIVGQNELTIIREGGVRCHLPGGQD